MELPAGTITMMFSDIEGSTALLSRLGDRYGEALSAQRAVLRAAISASHGREMGTEGDSFFVVFESAADAVECCLAAQQTLARHDWPGGVAVRVRMGLHSGQPTRHEDGYIGLDVHRAARIAAAAHGGQVVLSEATRLLAAPKLPAGASVRDLGFHRLKDIEAPEHIYQLAGLDLQPLAIELAASRVRLLAPRALLARLDHRLGLAAAAEAGRPLRQQTLRNTIGWSYELLAPDVAGVFRRMSVFAGGYDLDALAAVAMTGDLAGPDPLEPVAELADVSLIMVTEGADGEPRIGMLETIREYALERLEQDDDLDGARRRHAGHYAAFAERARDQLEGPAQLATLDRLEADNDNLRAALAWSLGTQDGAGQGERALIGLRLAQALTVFWYHHGHAAEGRRWLQRAMGVASADGGAPLARVAHGLGVLLDQLGEPDAARRLFERSLAIWRELGDREQQAKEVNSLGIVHRHLGDLEGAHALLEEAVAINRTIPGSSRLGAALANLGQLESATGRFDRATEVLREALTLDSEHGDPFSVAVDQHSLALVSLRAGRPREARDLLCGLFEYVASSGNTAVFLNTLELAAAIYAALGDPLRAARLAGAADAIRRESGMLITQQEAEMLERHLAPARRTVTSQAWDAELAAGRALSQQEAVTLLFSGRLDVASWET
jgi:predicted ATPase/Tfp pilus assembly protein PilF